MHLHVICRPPLHRSTRWLSPRRSLSLQKRVTTEPSHSLTTSRVNPITRTTNPTAELRPTDSTWRLSAPRVLESAGGPEAVGGEEAVQVEGVAGEAEEAHTAKRLLLMRVSSCSGHIVGMWSMGARFLWRSLESALVCGLPRGIMQLLAFLHQGCTWFFVQDGSSCLCQETLDACSRHLPVSS
jgi:hypothetical protein